MRIAQIAPLYESVPPKYYGGTERVVSYLTEELVHQGHDVSLFASGDSVTSAKLVPVTHRSLRLDKHCVDQLAHHVLLLQQVIDMQDQFDIIHFHIGYMHYPYARMLRTPHVSTQHGRLDLSDLVNLYSRFRDLPNISISNDQRRPMPWMNWVSTVYHGLPKDLYPFVDASGDYFAFLGRISPEKRVDRAIMIAKKVGVPIKIAAKVDAVDLDYFETTIKPLIDDPLVEFIGEIGEGEKAGFLGRAGALLFPIDWPEPFGIVMIEALACGTPVIAYRRGSVPEVITHGVTGFIVESIDDAVTAALSTTVDRKDCRATFEERFSSERMALDHITAYEKVIANPAASPATLLSPEAEAVSTWREIAEGRRD